MKVDLRNTDTKERIIEEATKQFQTGGYNHISLDAIAKTLNITRPALYFHFPGGKEQLLLEVIKFFGTKVIAHIQQAIDAGSDTHSRLRNLLMMVAHDPASEQHELILAHKDSVTFKAQEELKNTFYNVCQLVNGVLEDGIRNGELREVDINIAFFSLMGIKQQVEEYLMLQQILPEFVCNMPKNVEELVEQLLDLWFKGMNAPDKNCK